MGVWSTAQAVLDGVLLGALYALVGMGMALIFGVMRLVNFAHGAFLMLAMYATYVLFERLHVNQYLGFIAAAALLFGLGVVSYRFLLRRVAERSDFMQILLTLGLSLIVTDGVQLIFGADYRQINFPLMSTSWRIGRLHFNAPWVLSFAITAVLAVAIYLFVMRSRFGRALRAIAQNRYAAGLVGIDVQRTQALAFGLGLATVGVAGGLLLPLFYTYPAVGEQYTLKAFVIVVLGGMGSIAGAAIAGLVLGVVEELTSLFWGNQWALVVEFAIFLVVLSVRPSGLFGSQRA
ncbi:MAG TPA: branched-chain amino acid ABC transporter permease [Kofleriaceae bacterium]|nr:branched-chain amino acid ABC transporter permease [Kofleriaceae bacterium]